MTETLLSPQEEDILALAWWIINQDLPDQMVKRYGMILDFYLESCPVQARAILETVANFNEEDWI